MTQTALILGASGKIGTHFARAFEAAGWRVIRHNRQTSTILQDAMGADVIVNGLNPPKYHRWEVNIPRITEEVIAAAKASGATILMPGNVYVFGENSGEWSETTPHLATTKKGLIRIEMEAQYRAAASEGVRTIMLRAGDFIDPDKNMTLMNLVILKSANKGVLTSMGNPLAHHAWAYLPDLARAGVALAEKRSELAAYEDIPFKGHTFSMDEARAVLEARTGRSFKLQVFRWWMIGALRPFWGFARELWEMRYLSSVPHSLSGEKLARLLPDFHPTPLDQVLMTEMPEGMASVGKIGLATA